jgi:outer membrane protein
MIRTERTSRVTVAPRSTVPRVIPRTLALRARIAILTGVVALVALAAPAATYAQAGSAEALDLARFLDLVERNSLQLENARTDRSLAETQEDLVRSQIYPFIAGQAGYTRNFLDIEQAVPVAANAAQEVPGSVLGFDGGSYYPLTTREIDVNRDNEFSLGLSVQQKIFDMSVFRALEASRQFTDLTGTVYEASRQGILTEANASSSRSSPAGSPRGAPQLGGDRPGQLSGDPAPRRGGDRLADGSTRAEVNWKITEPGHLPGGSATSTSRSRV